MGLILRAGSGPTAAAHALTRRLTELSLRLVVVYCQVPKLAERYGKHGLNSARAGCAVPVLLRSVCVPRFGPQETDLGRLGVRLLRLSPGAKGGCGWAHGSFGTKRATNPAIRPQPLTNASMLAMWLKRGRRVTQHICSTVNTGRAQTSLCQASISDENRCNRQCTHNHTRTTTDQQ